MQLRPLGSPVMGPNRPRWAMSGLLNVSIVAPITLNAAIHKLSQFIANISILYFTNGLLPSRTYTEEYHELCTFATRAQ